ncbi:MAG TPA: hypothetical protein PKZ51_10105, partial [Saprospiraceae bacterium]|nr:hypothetical protein [Saprospiraceae bacterium]
MCVKLVLFLFWSSAIFSQTNFSFSNPEFEDFLKGNFQNDHFEKRLIQSDEMLPAWLKQQISPDSLSVFLHKIISFRNRNTIADTVTEPDKGIRGARKMISKYLQYLNERNFSVIEQSEFSFDYEMCG